jgi:hypothetical protein
VAALEVDEVFSLDDLRRLEGHPRFDSCGLSADNGKLPDLRGLCFGTDSLVGDGSNRGSDSTEDLLCSVEDPVGFLLSMMDRLYGPYSGSERSKDEQFDSSVEQVRSSDPPFSRSALRLCPIGGASQAAPVPRGFAWLRSAWPSIVERWLLLGPRRQGEDDFSLLSRLGYSTEDLPVGFRSSMVDRLDGPYSGSERSKDEQFDSSVEQVRSSDPPFSRSALRLCPIGGASQAAPVPRGFAWLRSAWPSIVERWLLLGPRRQGEDDPRCSLAWAPLPSPSPPPSLIGCERCAVVCGDVCVPGFGCGLACECVRLPPVERGAAGSGSQGAASESAAGSGRLRGCGR